MKWMDTVIEQSESVSGSSSSSRRYTAMIKAVFLTSFALSTLLIVMCENSDREFNQDFELIGFENEEIKALAIGIENEIIVATQNHETFYTSFIHATRDNGMFWDTLAQTPGSIKDIAVDSDGNIYTCGINNLKYNGSFWHFLDIPTASPDHLLITHEDYLVTSDTRHSGLIISYDNGNSWDLLGTSLKYSGVSAIASDTLGNYYVGYGRIDGDSLGVFRLSELDTVWRSIGLSWESIECLTVSNNGTIYAGTANGHIYVSTDHGENWSAEAHLSSYKISSIVIDSEGIVYASILFTDGGRVYISKDDGISWDLYYRGLPYISGADSETMVISYNNYLFIATHSGLYKSLNPVNL